MRIAILTAMAIIALSSTPHFLLRLHTLAEATPNTIAKPVQSAEQAARQSLAHVRAHAAIAHPALQPNQNMHAPLRVPSQ